jgi:hypothetical protein
MAQTKQRFDGFEPTIDDTSAPAKIGARSLVQMRYAGVAPSPGALAVQMKSRSPVQMWSTIGQAAEAGVAGASAPLPHAGAIQAAFGRHDVSSVRTATGGTAQDACSSMGALAYATGDTVAFAAAPDLHTAAHEAAHVVQQRGGVSLKSGVGEVGDAYEQHADRVADLVVAGKSAEAELDRMAGGGATRAVQRAPAPAAQGTATATASPAAAAPAPVAKATSLKNLAIRTGPGKDFPQVSVQPDWVGPGVSFDVLKSQGSWLQVTYKGAPSAWITGAAGWVTIVEVPPPAQGPEQPPAEAPPAEEPGMLESIGAALGEMVNDGIEFVTGLFTWPTAPTPPDQEQIERDAQNPGGTSGDLDTLMAKERLTPEEIAQARELIAKLPQEQQGPLFLQLQEKAEYANQRDNESDQEGKNGGTCNLTALAMALETLGVGNPGPCEQFEDSLVKIAEDLGMGSAQALTESDTWVAVAAKCNAKMEVLANGASRGPIARATWESIRDEHLAAGKGVIVSLWGHVIRLQGVTEDGLVVDDPFGASNLAESRRRDRTDDDGNVIVADSKYAWDGLNSQTAGEGDNKGEDLGYPWADVETYTFGIVMAVSL